MKTVILCGGLGTRLAEETQVKPKPMVEIGGRPILWHIMKIYASHGLSDFVLALGYKAEFIKDYFLHYHSLTSDLQVHLRSGQVEYANTLAEDWTVHLMDTGPTSMTGGRLKRLEPLLRPGGTFCFTYGDGVSDVDVSRALAFHRSHGKLATVTAVRPPARFGAMAFDGQRVASFKEKIDLDPKDQTFRLWAFGPDMDNMKARSWAEGTMPVPAPLPGMDAEQYDADIRKLVSAAEAAVKALRQAVRYGLLPKVDAKYDASLLQNVGMRFWSATERPFYATVNQLRQALAASQDTEPVRLGWLAALGAEAVSIYRRMRDELVDWRAAPEQAVRKEVMLGRKLSPFDKELAKILGLPAPARKSGKAA